MNEIVWNKNALKEIQEFPYSVKKEIGYLLFKLQIGEQLTMPHSRPMPSVNKGCYELRVRGTDGIYRAFYFTKLEKKILVFHAFQKKTQKTSLVDIEIGKKNLKAMMYEEEK